jgi:hypothetical protein
MSVRTVPLANRKQLEVARALPTRNNSNVKGKAYVYITREAMPCLLDSRYRVEGGLPPESEVVEFRYHIEMDRYELLIQSPFLPIVAEGAEVPMYSGIRLVKRGWLSP